MSELAALLPVLFVGTSCDVKRSAVVCNELSVLLWCSFGAGSGLSPVCPALNLLDPFLCPHIMQRISDVPKQTGPG